MLILVINCGSSSVKYRLFRADGNGDLNNLAGGLVSELGKETARLRYETPALVFEKTLDRPNYREALEAAISSLTHPEYGVLGDVSEIEAVGHRAVHGGDKFTGSVLIDQEVMAKMEQCKHLAPIHNPANLAGINQAMALLPSTPQVAVFDTAFHQTIPQHAALYALPYELYERHGIRKYGFHGTSCQYVCHRVAQVLNRPVDQARMVICHLGNGVSVSAVKHGRSIDTSLGFTSVGGVMMGTRCGDLDPGVLLYLMRELGFSLERVDRLLHYESGLLGVSGVSNDMRRITDLARAGDDPCRLALDMFTYWLRKYIGAYAAAMGGIDLLVFTGGIGENSPLVRSLVVKGLEFLGIEIDPGLNDEALANDCVISRKNTRVTVAVIAANEEQMIAQEALTLLAGPAGVGLRPNPQFDSLSVVSGL